MWHHTLAHFLLSGGESIDESELLVQYGVSDLDAVRAAQERRFEALPRLAKLYTLIELPVSQIIEHMRGKGIHIDTARLDEVQTQLTHTRTDLSARIKQVLGEVNLNSPKQLGDALVTTLKVTLPKTKTGQWSTGVDVLTPLAPQHELIRDILEFRVVDKILGTYVEPIRTFIGTDGRIHPTYIQTVASTGRLGCKDPNIQSTPITGEYGAMVRSYYTAPPGSYLIGCDYSQQELRILAHVSADAKLHDAFAKGIDVHVVTASEILGIPLDQVDKAARTIGKTLNFGIVYGETAFGLTRQLGKSPAECSEILKKYFETYSGVKQYFDNLLTGAKIHGKVETMYGRMRGIPGLPLGTPAKFLKGEQERILKNFPIQGSAADMTKAAMVKVTRDVLPHYPQASLIMQIHDELIFEYTPKNPHPVILSGAHAKSKDLVPPEVYAFQKAVVESMQNAVKLSVPVVVESSIGTNWSMLK